MAKNLPLFGRKTFAAKVAASFATVAVLFTLSGPAAAELLYGKVVGVSDGDTITVLDSANMRHKIRLNQIDAPEKRQAFGQRSKQSLSDLVFGRNVQVDVATRDRYGREIGQVLVNGADANLEQVKRGMAWVYRQYAKDLAYFDAEEKAKRSGVGLWSKSNPVPPWEYRHTRRISR
jgi:micrococcal nuclease